MSRKPWLRVNQSPEQRSKSVKETGFYKRTTGKWRKTETDFHPPPSGYADWRLELIRYLISGGVTGRGQTLITNKFTNWAYADAVRYELEVLLAEGKVQKFIVPRGGKGLTKTIWRATDKILED